MFGDSAWRVPGEVDQLAFVDDDGVLVTTRGGDVALFDAAGARTLLPDALAGWIAALAPPQGYLETAGDGHVVSRGEVDDAPLVVAGGPVLAHSRGFESPRIVGDRVIAGRRDRAVGIWELATGARYRVFGGGNSNRFALSHDHRWVVIGTFPGTPHWAVDIYRVDDGARVASVGFACNPDAVAISPDDQRYGHAAVARAAARHRHAGGGHAARGLRARAGRPRVRSARWLRRPTARPARRRRRLRRALTRLRTTCTRAGRS